MSRWYDKAVEQLEQDLEDGAISSAEFQEQMRDLNAELHAQADEEAERARADVLGYW